MKAILQMLAIVAITIGFQGCNSKSTQTAEEKDACCSEKSANKDSSCCAQKQEVKSCCSANALTTTEIQAYYFHATRRCATCEAVEKVTAETLKNKYNGKISFVSINREEDKDNPLLDKYKVDGQTLLVVKGEKVINLTTEAFLNARSNPEKLQAKLVSTVDAMMN